MLNSSGPANASDGEKLIHSFVRAFVEHESKKKI